MDYRKFVTTSFNEWVALNKHNYPADMLEGLMNHERFPVFVDNMTQQIKVIASRTTIPKGMSPVDGKRVLKDTVYSMAEYFANLAKQHSDEYHMSVVNKAAIKEKASQEDQIRRALKHIQPADAIKHEG